MITQTVERKRRRDRFLFLLLLTTILLLLVTRLITVTHNMELHPDEHVFYQAADSLMRFIMGTAETFEEVKEYPEGAIVLQMPFHIAGELLRRWTDMDLSMRLCSRLASVFYFTLGAALGIVIEYRFFGKNRRAAAAYSALVILSVMHLEQSRYGTGDAISLFLTMAILYLTAAGEKAEPGKKLRGWLAAGFLTGMLGAVKYPLLFWGLLPMCAVLKTEGLPRRRKTYILGLFAAAVLVGFLFVSPKTAADPRFIIRTLRRETYSYVLKGNVTEVGGPLNHFLCLTIYALLYSGFPLTPVFLAAAVRERNRPARQESERSRLLDKTLPRLIAVFFFYNLFSKTMFMRNVYPFFFLSDLYVAEYLGGEHGKKERAVLCLLAGLFLLRGVYYVGILTEKQGPENLERLVARAADESWNKTTLLNTTYSVEIDTEKLVKPEKANLFGEEYEDADQIPLERGEMVITGQIEYYRGTGYLIPVRNEQANEYVRRWKAFKQVNGEYFVGSVYPMRYYYLFGYWLKGTGGAGSEFPTNYVYYRGAQ